MLDELHFICVNIDEFLSGMCRQCKHYRDETCDGYETCPEYDEISDCYIRRGKVFE